MSEAICLNAPYFEDFDEKAFTRIEMPWGIYLTPLGSYGKAQATRGEGVATLTQSFLWEHSTKPNVSGKWAELWSTALQNSAGADSPNQFEVLGVRGFSRTVTANSPKGSVTTYIDDPKDQLPDWLGCAGSSNGTTPVCNIDRIELATSLSRRFKFTGDPGPPVVNTGSVYYDSPFNPQKISVNACFADGRNLTVDQFRLSARGGSLELDNKWKVFKGCDLDGWKHLVTAGRDDEVELVSAGYLYPLAWKLRW